MDWLAFLPTLITALVSFVAGWCLFELTEWRRRVTKRKELRSALVTELKNAEVLASYTVVKYTRYLRDRPKTVGDEIRWFRTVGRGQMEAAGVVSKLPEGPSALEELDDERLVDLFSHIDETVGSKLIFPILGSVLAGQMSGFSAQQIATLGMVHWHAHLLAQNADAMKEFLQMTFTIMDDTNHPRVVQNHEKQSAAYAQRAVVLLGVVRRSLELLN